MMDIEAKDITARFGSTTVLQGVDFDARSGEMVGLIGPNGSGKTTLLRILANLRTPEAGAVHYVGKTAGEFGARDLARRVAYLAQGGEVHWPLRAEALVALGRLPHRGAVRRFGCGRSGRGRARDGGRRRHPFSRPHDEQVSGGERMRILLARALAVEGDLLLADEPTAALDPLHQLQVMQLLRATLRDGRGVIVVLHDLALAMRFCDRLVLLAEGGVIVQGPPSDVLTDDHIRRAYGVEVVRGERDGLPFLLPWAPRADLKP